MGNNTKYRLFIDLDGVLADFNSGVKEATGFWPHELEIKKMWPILAQTSDFYDKLKWMEDGKLLWDFVSPYLPTILTGLPLGQWAEPQKRSWCNRELGSQTPVLCCLSKDKGKAASNILQAGEIPLLVDDRLKAKPGWDDIGGVFILHRESKSSIDQLKELGYS
jgi:hypothetical protein